MAAKNGQNKWALLIGIDRYNSSIVPDLSGCSKDIDLMENYLRESVGISNISKLKSPARSNGQAAASDNLPTSKNVVAALENLAAKAQNGDFVYIHFSGHGSRLPTQFKQLNCNVQDECLVLVREDLSDTSIKVDYLRDVEFAYLLKQISDKGATVTIVLDCCHSGGACRDIPLMHNHDALSVLRGVDFLPEDALEARSPICELSALEPFQNASPVRGASVAPHWLTSSQGVEFLAACRANEKAQEIQRGDRKYRGLLTDCLLSVLKDNQIHPKPLTCGMIYNLVSRKVANHPNLTHEQNVVFGGERRRVFFGTDRGALSQTTVTSTTYLPDKKLLQVGLSAGTAHGVSKNDVYAIYPPDQTFTSLMDYNSPSAICHISEVKDFASTGVVKSDGPSIRIDSKATRQSEILRKYVLKRRSAKLLMPNGRDTKVRESMETRMRERAQVRFDDDQPFFTVNLHVSGRFRIAFTPKRERDTSGIETSIDVRSEMALLSHLKHLSVFYNLLDLADSSKSGGGLAVKKLGYLPNGIEPPDPCRYDSNTPLIVDGIMGLTISDPQDIFEGDHIGIEVRNTSHKTMSIEILDLDPSWEATRVYPLQGNCPIELLPSEATNFFCKMWMPKFVQDVVNPAQFDSIIVLATTATNGRENFPVGILPTLGATPDWHNSPLKEVENTRGATGSDSATWYAQRVDVRVKAVD